MPAQRALARNQEMGNHMIMYSGTIASLKHLVWKAGLYGKWSQPTYGNWLFAYRDAALEFCSTTWTVAFQGSSQTFDSLQFRLAKCAENYDLPGFVEAPDNRQRSHEAHRYNAKRPLVSKVVLEERAKRGLSSKADRLE